MVFSSIVFLFFFLPLTLAAYFVAPARAKNPVLLVANLVFYTWGGGVFVLILLASIGVNWANGVLLGRAVERGDSTRARAAIVAAVVINLLTLSYFKYANFAVEQVNNVADQFGIGPVAWTSVALPIGVSFYTFQSMSYAFDVARGRCSYLRNPLEFALFVSLFPHLIAGPLVRFHEIAHELHTRTTRFEDFAEGSVRFMYGLAKKVLIADTLAPIADVAFGRPAGDLSVAGAWIGLLAYTFQIYFDFSGYSDMAIGLARMFGFHFPENFNRPYSALSLTDFWRRWHITLSNWFRDYVYIPLGGSRGSGGRTALNLILVFTLTGIWHGAAWTFVAWGLLHGSVLLWERYRGTRYVDAAPHEVWSRARTFVIVALLWVFFRSTDLPDALEYLGALFGAGTGLVSGDLVFRTLDLREIVVLLVGLGTLALPRDLVLGKVVCHESGRAAASGRVALVALAFPLTLLLVISGTFSPFLYFQF